MSYLQPNTGVADLEEMMLAQYALQRDAYGHDPATMPTAERCRYLLWNVVALEDELHEAMKEFRWKNWTSVEPFVHEDRLQGEVVDALHFLLNLCIASGMTAADVHRRFMEKNRRNRQRQVDGYTGLDKCSVCSRAFDDIGGTRRGSVCGVCGDGEEA